MTFGALADAVDAAFGRWDFAHLHTFDLIDGMLLIGPGAAWDVMLVRAQINDEQGLTEAFGGCEAVAHCAGINREIGSQTYQAVHVAGTSTVVCAAEGAGVRRLATENIRSQLVAIGIKPFEGRKATM